MNIDSCALLKASPLQPQRAKASTSKPDHYLPSERPDPGLIPRPSRLYHTALAAGLLVSGGGMAQAADQALVQKTQDASSKGVALMASQTEGAVQEVLNGASQGPGPSCTQFDPVCGARLQRLPKEAQGEYLSMPASVKQMLSKKMNGKTTVIPLVLVVNHRKSFVKGEAFGQNVFDFVSRKVKGMAEEGKLSSGHAERAQRFLEVCRRLTPEQRDDLVELITRDAKFDNR